METPFKVYPNEFIYVINTINVIERVTDNPTLAYSRVEIYPAKGVDVGANIGLLLPNTGDIYVGLSGIVRSASGVLTTQYTTDLIQASEINNGRVILLNNGGPRVIGINQLIIRAANTGDGIFVRAVF